MKRFVTYLYLYDGRMKGNNAGFIKVEINGEKSAFLVQIKNLGKYSGKGKVYLIYEAEAAIEAGELTVWGRRSGLNFGEDSPLQMYGLA